MQFVYLMLHFGKSVIGWCPYTRHLAWAGVFQNGVLFALFGNFYWRTYWLRRPAAKAE